MTNELTGQIAVGRFVLQIGGPAGAVLREATPATRIHHHPRPSPVLVRPPLIRRLLGRQVEVATALSALDAGLPIELSGEPGIGKTAILRHLAHHARASSFADGIAYIRARRQPFSDLLQLIFEAFHEIDGISLPTDAEIRRGLRDTRALILLDDLDLTPHELEQVLDIAPQSSFAVATRERCLWGEVRSIVLAGLSPEDGVSLLERELERALDDAERSAAAGLCAALGGHPVRIMQAAALIRDHGIPLDERASGITPAALIGELTAGLDEKQRRALLALTALPGVPLTAQHVSAIAEVPDIEPVLRTLTRRGLVGGSHARHRLAEGVADQLRRSDDLKPWVNRAITYFTAWAERYRRSPANLLEESEALLAVQQHAFDARRWTEALRVGTLLEGTLITGARWGAWAKCLECCHGAARALADRGTEAWVLHEAGTRAVCVGDPGRARRILKQAVAMREAIDDAAGAAVSRQNLALVLVPEANESRDAMPFADVTDLDSFALPDESFPAGRTPAKGGAMATARMAAQMVLVAGLAFFATRAALQGSWSVARTSTAAAQPVQAAASADMRPAPSTDAGYPVPPPPANAAAADRASILIFTPRPGSIASSGGSTRLCYAVSGAVQARVEPGVGEVAPSSTLTCVRVAPSRTTTYQLDAVGRDGRAVSRQLVIVVR